MDPYQLAAVWLIGVSGAFNIRGYPKWLDRQLFFAHKETAYSILKAKPVNNPICLWELRSYVNELSKKITPPLNLPEA